MRHCNCTFLSALFFPFDKIFDNFTLQKSREVMDKTTVLKKFNQMCANTLMHTLNIEFIDVGDDFLTAKMPVNPTVHQPMGLLHGGASVALAESVGSAASALFVDHQK